MTESRYIFGWNCYQPNKQGLTFGTLNMLGTCTALGGSDVSSHGWGRPLLVAFDRLEDALAVRQLVEEQFETFLAEDSAPWPPATA